ncbi:MAG: hypothetical protein V1897_03710, partial [Pseudomonadota bacterium]
MARKLPSLIIVLFVVIIFSCVETFAQWPLGKDTTSGSTKQQESAGYLTGSGRFQIFVSSNIKGHTFMLDAETGRIWIFKKDNTSGEMSLQRIPVDQLNESESLKSNHP